MQYVVSASEKQIYRNSEVNKQNIRIRLKIKSNENGLTDIEKKATTSHLQLIIKLNDYAYTRLVRMSIKMLSHINCSGKLSTKHVLYQYLNFNFKSFSWKWRITGIYLKLLIIPLLLITQNDFLGRDVIDFVFKIIIQIIPIML